MVVKLFFYLVGFVGQRWGERVNGRVSENVNICKMPFFRIISFFCSVAHFFLMIIMLISYKLVYDLFEQFDFVINSF